MDDDLQLIRLAEAFADDPDPTEMRSLALEWASRGLLPLYVLVPEGQVACTEAWQISRSVSMRRLVSIMQRQQVIRAKARGEIAFERPEIHPEICCLTLSRQSAASLHTTSSAKVQWFVGGLRRLADDKGLGRVERRSPFCLRAHTGREMQRGSFQSDGGAASERTTHITLADVLMSKQAEQRICEAAWAVMPDLKYRALGIDAMFRTFRKFYSVSPVTKAQADEKRAGAELDLRNFDGKLFGEVRGKHAARLIATDYSRNRGKRSDEQVRLDETVLNSAPVQKYKRRNPTMSDSFAVVLHATGELYARYTDRAPSRGKMALDAIELLKSYGFGNKGQLQAMAFIIAWQPKSPRT